MLVYDPLPSILLVEGMISETEAAALFRLAREATGSIVEIWPLIDVEDPHVGYALPRAIRAGLDVRGVVLNGTYWDCGTPDDYFDCIAAHRVAETA